MKMVLKNIEDTFKALSIRADELTQEEARKISRKLFEDLKDKTPVDTGLARDSWVFTEKDKRFDITNDVEYIKYLNQGSSQQAPARFIESTALKYGKPIGTIVQVTGE